MEQLKRDWRKAPPRVREVHHEALPDDVRRLIVDLGKLAADQAARIKQLEATVGNHQATISVIQSALTEDA